MKAPVGIGKDPVPVGINGKRPGLLLGKPDGNTPAGIVVAPGINAVGCG